MAPNEAEYARGEGAFDEVIATDVGPNSQRIFLPKKLACNESEFFKAATKLEWDHGVVDLSDEDPIIITAFVHWLFVQRIHIQMSPKLRKEHKRRVESMNEMNEDELNTLDAIMIAAYHFAQRRLCPGFQDALLTTYVQILNFRSSHLSSANVSLAFDHGTDGSHLQSLIVDNAVWLIINGKDDFLEEYENTDFLIQLSKVQGALNRQKGNKSLNDLRILWKNICRYHQHGPTVRCASTSLSANMYANFTTYARTRTHSAGPGTKVFHSSVICETGEICHSSDAPPMLLYHGLSSTSLEMLLQLKFFDWSLNDIVGCLLRRADKVDKDLVFHAVLELNVFCRNKGNEKLENDTIDAIAHWHKVTGLVPYPQELDAALTRFRCLPCSEPIRLLAAMYAMEVDIVKSKNITFLQMVMGAHAASRHAFKELANSVHSPLRITLPWSDENLCSYYHNHADIDRICYDENEVERNMDWVKKDWIQKFHEVFQDMLMSIPCQCKEESTTTSQLAESIASPIQRENPTTAPSQSENTLEASMQPDCEHPSKRQCVAHSS